MPAPSSDASSQSGSPQHSARASRSSSGSRRSAVDSGGDRADDSNQMSGGGDTPASVSRRASRASTAGSRQLPPAVAARASRDQDVSWALNDAAVPDTASFQQEPQLLCEPQQEAEAATDEWRPRQSAEQPTDDATAAPDVPEANIGSREAADLLIGMKAADIGYSADPADQQDMSAFALSAEADLEDGAPAAANADDVTVSMGWVPAAEQAPAEYDVAAASSQDGLEGVHTAPTAAVDGGAVQLQECTPASSGDDFAAGDAALGAEQQASVSEPASEPNSAASIEDGSEAAAEADAPEKALAYDAESAPASATAAAVATLQGEQPPACPLPAGVSEAEGDFDDEEHAAADGMFPAAAIVDGIAQAMSQPAQLEGDSGAVGDLVAAFEGYVTLATPSLGRASLGYAHAVAAGYMSAIEDQLPDAAAAAAGRQSQDILSDAAEAITES